MAAARYFDLIREMRDAYNHRLRLVESVRQRGIKPTARLFTTTVPTVRKWWRRYQQHGPSGLLEQSRAPHHQPRKTAPYVGCTPPDSRTPTVSESSRSGRIWRVHGLLKRRRRKYQRKQDLTHIKAQWALFQQISADTKDLACFINLAQRAESGRGACFSPCFAKICVVENLTLTLLLSQRLHKEIWQRDRPGLAGPRLLVLEEDGRLDEVNL
jgi:transposase-like protein